MGYSVMNVCLKPDFFMFIMACSPWYLRLFMIALPFLILGMWLDMVDGAHDA